MKTIPANVVLEKNRRASAFAWLSLLDIDLTNGNSYHVVRNNVNVSFLDDDYVAAGCVAHYKMNDNLANTTVIDSSGNGNTGTLTGGANTEDNTIIGKINAAQQFDGAVDYVDTGSPFQSTFRVSFSSSIWVKPDEGHPVAAEYVFATIDTTGATSTAIVLIGTDGKITFQYNSEGNAGNDAETDSAVFAAGAASEWTHIIVVADSTGKKIYVNGVEATLDSSNDGSTSGVTFSEWTSVHNIYIGAVNNSGSDTNHFAGGLDNVILFNRVLTQADVDVLFNAKSDYDAAGCVSHYKLDDYAADTVVLDSSGNSNDGTLIGGDDTQDKNIVGKVRGAFLFNGSDDYFSTPINPTTIGSYGVWFKVTTDLTERIMMGSHSAGPSGRCYLSLNAASKLSAGIGSESFVDIFGGDTLVTDTWYFGVLTWDGTTVNLYLNSTNIYSAAQSGAVNTTDAIFVGANNPDGAGADLFWDGTLDNVMIFDRVLTQADIIQLYNSGNGTELVPNAYGVGTELVPVVYTAFPFDVETLAQDLKGQLTTLIIRVSNVTRLLEVDLQALDGGGGSTVTLTIANSGIITEDYSELKLTFDVLSSQITSQYVDFELGIPSTLRERFPLLRYLGLSCGHKYTGGTSAGAATFPECGFIGAQTTCEKNIQACIDRNNQTRYGAQIGLRSGGIRVA